MRTGPRGILSTHLNRFETVALGGTLYPALNLRVRPSTTLRIQPGQVLHRYMHVVLISNTHYLACDALANLVLNPSRLSTDSLRLSSKDLGVLVSVVDRTEIRSLV